MFPDRSSGFDCRIQQPATSHFLKARRPRVLLLVLNWRSIACALGSFRASVFNRILMTVMSAAIGMGDPDEIESDEKIF